MSNNTSHDRPDLSENAGEYYFTAPVEMPSREQMKVKLVPLHLVDRLEEARSDEQFWGAVFWTVAGAILGIICEWVTSDPINVTRPSLVVLAILVVVGALALWGGVRKYKDRAGSIRMQVNQAGENLPDSELETLRKQDKEQVLTLISGEVGEFSNTRSGPWVSPVVCSPMHSRWRSIEGAKWMWIKERPTDEEAQRGQTVWHRFSFDLGRSTASVREARFALMVDDYADVIINGRSVRQVSISDEIVELDVAPFLCSGKNVVEIKIENQATPQATALSNPTGIIYRLDIQ